MRKAILTGLDRRGRGDGGERSARARRRCVRRPRQAKANLVAYTAKPVFTAPGPAFDAKKCAAGKKMLSIPNSSGNPFLKGIIDREKAAGSLLGWRSRNGKTRASRANGCRAWNSRSATNTKSSI